jgi:hypothetical protein
LLPIALVLIVVPLLDVAAKAGEVISNDTTIVDKAISFFIGLTLHCVAKIPFQKEKIGFIYEITCRINAIPTSLRAHLYLPYKNIKKGKNE